MKRDYGRNIIFFISLLLGVFLFPGIFSQEAGTNISGETKRDSCYTYKLNDGDSTLSARTVFFYNEYRQNILTLDQDWNTKSNEWDNTGKKENIFDNRNRIIRTTSFLWQSAENGWVPDTMYKYMYDDGDHVIRKSTFLYQNDISGGWLETDREEKAFDSLDRMISHATYYYDYTTEKLTGSFRKDIGYDEWGHMNLNVSFKWDTTSWSWIKTYRQEIIYQDANVLKTVIFSNYDPSSAIWFPSRKQDYSYNKPGLTDTLTYYSYNRNTGSWEFSYKWVTTYDTLHYTSIAYELAFNDAKWDTTGRDLRTYCNNNWNCYTSVVQDLDTTSHDWKNNSKEFRNKIFFADGGYWRARFCYFWSDTANRWLHSLGYTTSRNGKGKRTSFCPYSPSTNYDTVYPNFKDTMQYRSDGSLLFKISYNFWDPTSSFWEEGSKTSYYYNSDNQLTLIHIFSLSPPDTWIEDKRTRYFYGDFILPDTSTFITDGGTLYANLETAAAYQWYNCETGEDISGANLIAFIPPAPGSYAVRITTGNYIVSSGCRDTRTLSSRSPDQSAFRCYPNPSSGLIHIDPGTTGTNDIMIRVTDLSGYVIRTIRQYPGQTAPVILDLSGLSGGMYLLRFYLDGKPAGREKIILIK